MLSMPSGRLRVSPVPFSIWPNSEAKPAACAGIMILSPAAMSVALHGLNQLIDFFHSEAEAVNEGVGVGLEAVLAATLFLGLHDAILGLGPVGRLALLEGAVEDVVVHLVAQRAQISQATRAVFVG